MTGVKKTWWRKWIPQEIWQNIFNIISQVQQHSLPHSKQRAMTCYIKHTPANKCKAHGYSKSLATCPQKSIDSLDIDWIWAFIQQHCPLRAGRGWSVWILLRKLLRAAADGRRDNARARVTRFSALFRGGRGCGYTGGDRVKVIIIILQTGSFTNVCGWIKKKKKEVKLEKKNGQFVKSKKKKKKD